MKTAMITRDENQIPSVTIEAIRNSGIILACKACKRHEDLLELASDADVIWITGASPLLTAEVLDFLPCCKVLFRSGSGIDSLPLKRASELGIKVCNTPESISESVAEHAVALLFVLARHIVQFDKQVHEGKWDSSNAQTQWHLTGRTLGLIGYGHIAKAVERMVSGFNMHVLHCDPFSSGSVTLDELLRESDFISLHCPLTSETHHLINAQRLSLMKRSALLINTSRGSVIDEHALCNALENNIIAGAALDVLDDEPPNSDNPLLKCERVIITPHVAAFSADFEKNFWRCSVEKLIALQKEF